ncbi:hypothetical protein HZB02_00400 [Candidatus Woesearchaeota archaeon]|nr:hypothetical protein [Candidatus Woesearchaeota archaeon]
MMTFTLSENPDTPKDASIKLNYLGITATYRTSNPEEIAILQKATDMTLLQDKHREVFPDDFSRKLYYAGGGLAEKVNEAFQDAAKAEQLKGVVGLGGCALLYAFAPEFNQYPLLESVLYGFSIMGGVLHILNYRKATLAKSTVARNLNGE